MELLARLARVLGCWHIAPESPDVHEPTAINPATGLPTMGGVGTPDIAGNPFGIDLQREYDDGWSCHHRWDTGASFDNDARWHGSWSTGGDGGGHDPWRD